MPVNRKDGTIYTYMLRVYLPMSALALVLFVGIILTGLYNLYNSVPYFDKYMHVAGGFVVAWLVYALFRDLIAPLSFFSRLVFLAGNVALVGIAWEITEYYSNRFEHIFPTFYYYFHGGGLYDTLVDMVANVVGGCVYALIWARKRG